MPAADPEAPPLWVLFTAFLLASFSQSVSGFGQAIIWNFLMREAATILHIKYNLQKVVALLVGGDIFVAGCMVIIGRNHIDFRVVAAVGLPLLMFTVIGNFALIYVNVVVLERSIGAAILIYSIHRWFELRGAKNKTSTSTHSDVAENSAGQVTPASALVGAEDACCNATLQEVYKPPIWVAVACGAGAGFLGGCTGISGPVLAIYFASTTMDKTAVRSTFQSCLLIMTSLNTSMMFAEGVIQIGTDAVDYAVILMAGILGVCVGDRVHHCVSDLFVRYMMLILCMAAGCTLLAVGDLLISVYIALGVLAFLMAAVMVSSLFRMIQSRRRVTLANVGQ